MQDNTPTKDILWSFHNANLTWKTIVGELIDNSLDASAKNIQITLRRKEITIADDGLGAEDTLSMIRLGSHASHVSTKSGRYGVGLKHASLWLWGETRIVTACNGLMSVRRINWDEELNSKEWVVDDPAMFPVSREKIEYEGLIGESGTTIAFREIVRGWPKDIKLFASDMGFMFTPAIKSGVSIQFVDRRKGRSKIYNCQPYQLPELSSEIETDVEVAGRSVHVKAGVVPEGVANPHPGFQVCHAFRILSDGGIGLGEFNSGRIAGFVTLGSDWGVTTNKDDISEHRDELDKSVVDACRQILEEADKQDLVVGTAAIEDELTSMISSALKIHNGKEKRDKGDTEGSVQPKNTQRKRRKPSKMQPGDNPLENHRSGQIRIKIDYLGEERGLGVAKLSSNVIILNRSIERIESLREEGNVIALYLVASTLLSAKHSVQEKSGQNLFSFPAEEGVGFEESFLQAFQHLVNGVDNRVLESMR